MNKEIKITNEVVEAVSIRLSKKEVLDLSELKVLSVQEVNDYLMNIGKKAIEDEINLCVLRRHAVLSDYHLRMVNKLN